LLVHYGCFRSISSRAKFWFVIGCIPFLFLGIHYYNKERQRQEAKEQLDRAEREHLEKSRTNREQTDNMWKTGRKILDFFDNL
jgi:hypothetical protein